MNEQEIQQVEDAIGTVVSKFRRTPNVFLTEDDLRLHLAGELLKHFGRDERTRDADISISVHCEVRWYGDGSLKTRSDIVLVDVSSLDVLRYAKMPSKGYGFNTAKAIIELKLRRPNGCSNPRFLDGIEEDLNKLTELSRIFCEPGQPYPALFWMLIFDKKDALSVLPPSDGIRVEYCSSKAVPNPPCALE